MLDADLAAMYAVTTFNLNKAVKRNIDRFPEDFMFQLRTEEFTALRFHIGRSKRQRRGGRRYAPYVFTAQGVAMLSSVLRSKRAIQVNITIMRAFVKLRELAANHKANDLDSSLLRPTGRSVYPCHICARSRSRLGVRNHSVSIEGKGIIGIPAASKEKGMKESQFPPGWDEPRVRRVLAHYEEQSEEQAVAEDEAAADDQTQAVMEIPNDLVPAVRELIAKRRAS